MSLEGRRLTFRVGSKPLVQDVSISLHPGQIIAIVGPNGAGKSTLLKLLTGDFKAASGEVCFDGVPLSRLNPQQRALRRAVLPQSSTLGFHFKTFEVVLMGRTPHVRGVETPRDYKIAHEALNLTGVAHLAERIYTGLSGGEQQRVQLARALAQIWDEQPGQPRYLLLDEPTNNLDLAHQHGTMQIARWLAARGVGVLAILHDLNLAAQYADQIMLMVNGRVLTSGTPDRVMQPSFVREAFAMEVLVEQHPQSQRPYLLPLSST